MTLTATLDVECPSRQCGYVGPAPLVQVPPTDFWAEHWAVVCPECARGWIVMEVGCSSVC